MRPAALLLPVLLLAPLLPDDPAAARTLAVGPQQPFPVPSAAARAAQDGDVVLIEPGEYYDCAVWTQDHLVIAGAGPGVVITDSTCQGKAVFVVTGHDTTIRDLTLARARVPDRNGAGIRQEGQDLTLQRVRFVNNEVGLMDGAAGAGAIRISGCTFEAGGIGGDRPSFAVLVGAVSLLRIEGSTFKGVKGGQMNTAAARTELAGNQIDTGTGEQPAVAVLSSGGHLVMQDNLLSIGPNAPRLAAAVLVTGDDAPELRRNRLLNTTGRPAALLLDWTSQNPVLQDNVVGRGDAVLSTDEVWRHRASVLYHGAKDEAHAVAGQVKRGLLGLLAR
jgi:hypothetical protein